MQTVIQILHRIFPNVLKPLLLIFVAPFLVIKLSPSLVLMIY
jgi:hypothetical protein